MVGQLFRNVFPDPIVIPAIAFRAPAGKTSRALTSAPPSLAGRTGGRADGRDVVRLVAIPLAIPALAIRALSVITLAALAILRTAVSTLAVRGAAVFAVAVR